ncbi:MAG: RidA family protein [Bryobacterales bacterium]|nr:RidA family protein [Bryobacterales bacterium]
MKEIISTELAPKAIGPYSQAVKHHGLVFCSGQIPLDPATGQLVEGGIEEQTVRVLESLGAVLRAAGASYETVLKTTIFVQDLNDFAAVNEVYGRYFPVDPPARATVQAARLPRDVKVEIEAIAFT